MADDQNPTNDANEKAEAAQGEAAQENADAQQGTSLANVAVPNYLQELPVQVDVILGSMKLSVKELMECGPGSVIDVGKKVSDPFDLYVNNNLVARGEIVMIHDRLGLKIVEVVDAESAKPQV